MERGQNLSREDCEKYLNLTSELEDWTGELGELYERYGQEHSDICNSLRRTQIEYWKSKAFDLHNPKSTIDDIWPGGDMVICKRAQVCILCIQQICAHRWEA